MQNTKMVIVIRKDLFMRKGKFASQVANAALQFLFANNESQRSDELHIKLSHDEVIWSSGSLTKLIATIDSENALKDLLLKAQIHGIPAYPIYDSKVDDSGDKILTGASFGPSSGEDLSSITSKLKFI